MCFSVQETVLEVLLLSLCCVLHSAGAVETYKGVWDSYVVHDDTLDVQLQHSLRVIFDLNSNDLDYKVPKHYLPFLPQ